MTRLRFRHVLDNLVQQYECCFDVEEPYTYGNRVLAAYAKYILRMEKHVLLKRKRLDAQEANEHVFIIHAEYLDEATWEAEKQFLLRAERDFVIPHNGHMYSYLTLLLLCGTIAPHVKREIRGFRFSRRYNMALQGYSAARVAALDLSDGSIAINHLGKDVRDVLHRACGSAAQI